MYKNKKLIGFIAVTLIAIALTIMIGPADKFTHGYYSEEIRLWELPWQNITGSLSLAEQNGEIVFSPVKDHLAGFEIVYNNSESGNSGNLLITVTDERGKTLDSITLQTGKITESGWYKVKTGAKYKKGSRYRLTLSSDSGEDAPLMICMTQDYLPAETLEGDILLNYAYAEPTFSPEKKVLLILFIISLWSLAGSCLLGEKFRKPLGIASGIILVTTALSWNYMYNVLDVNNEKFTNFQDDSEILVTGMLYADREGTYFANPEERGYGLGYYRNIGGRLFNYREGGYPSDTEWDNGYSKNSCSIKVSSNDYSIDVTKPGNVIRFSNGDSFVIENAEDDGSNIVVTLQGDKHLTPRTNGSLDDAEFFSPSGEKLESGRIIAYRSQFGLQGKIFKVLAGFIKGDDILPPLNLLTSLAMAVTVVLITFLVSKKYNGIMAGCFLVTFALSPWVVNFARNLYWVEFTWFLPMAAGIFTSWKADNRKCRIIGYALSFFTILVKSLCGYEYITAVMLGLVFFPMTDFFIALAGKKKEKALLILRITLIMGAAALAGFIAAMVIHSRLGVNAGLISDIKSIINDVGLRRTAGADLNTEHPVLWESINASVWDTIAKYFAFSTQIIPGINGNLFPILCIIPLCFFAYDLKKKAVRPEEMILYAVSFIVSLSWFVFGKSHSYVHTHINFVIWYFGFVQICFYIIVSRIIGTVKALRIENPAK